MPATTRSGFLRDDFGESFLFIGILMSRRREVSNSSRFNYCELTVREGFAAWLSNLDVSWLTRLEQLQDTQQQDKREDWVFDVISLFSSEFRESFKVIWWKTRRYQCRWLDGIINTSTDTLAILRNNYRAPGKIDDRPMINASERVDLLKVISRSCPKIDCLRLWTSKVSSWWWWWWCRSWAGSGFIYNDNSKRSSRSDKEKAKPETESEIESSNT